MKVAPRMGEKLSVLVVDDEAEILELLHSFLEAMKCWDFIVQAKDGKEAIQKIQNQRFDLVITDLNMPRAGGMEIVKTLHNLEKDKPFSTPVLILSANITGETLKQATALGVKYALTKPCSSETFMEKITGILKREKRQKIKIL